jgi:hypothetical protein
MPEASHQSNSGGYPPGVALNAPLAASRDCVHESVRLDGMLDDCCLRCGADGYWHDGQRLDVLHPSGKVLFRLPGERRS